MKMKQAHNWRAYKHQIYRYCNNDQVYCITTTKKGKSQIYHLAGYKPTVARGVEQEVWVRYSDPTDQKEALDVIITSGYDLTGERSGT